MKRGPVGSPEGGEIARIETPTRGEMMSEAFPADGRIAGIDYGTVRIGVAVTDAERILASPHETYARGNEEADRAYFRCLVADEDLVGFVIGLPVHTSGEESKKSIEARRFGQWLHAATQLPITFFDERFTTVQAEQWLRAADMRGKRRKQRVDQVAAQIMLAAFVDARRTGAAADCLPLDDGDKN